jgi:cation diffusion facilitator family transporter
MFSGDLFTLIIKYMEREIYPKKITSEKVVVTSLIVDISDVLINVLVAIVSGSVVMLSQALEGAADLFASGFLLIGVKRSKLPSDKRHPYGYGRELYFWTFLSALATFIVTAGASFYFGLQRYINPEPINRIDLSFAALLIAIVTNGYSLTLSLRRLLGTRSVTKIWEAFNHSAFIETKTTLVLDFMGTIASILGLISLVLYELAGDLRFDGIGAMAIGITLAFLATFVIKGAKDLLVGQSAPAEVEEKIIKTVKAFPRVKSVLDLRTLLIGPERLLVNIEVHLADKLTTDEIETLIDKIEKEIKKEVPSARNIQIELETPDVQ